MSGLNLKKAFLALMILIPFWTGGVARAENRTYFFPLVYSDWMSGTITDAMVDQFKTALAGSSFTVEDWGPAFGRVDVGDLVCKGILTSGYGNNADAPYMIFNEQGEWPGLGTVTIPRIFQLRPDEAVVFIGRTPPQVAYFSYRSYLFDHIYEDALGNKETLRIFSSLGDTLNNRTIQTVGSDPFQQYVMIIITADRTTDARVRAAAQAVGILPGQINTDILPAEVLRLGTENLPPSRIPSSFDTLVFLQRIYLNEGPAGPNSDYEKYLQNPGARVLRVTPSPPVAVPDPFPMPVLRTRGTGTTEVDLLPALEDLRRAILNKYAGHTASELTTGIWLNEWLDGIERKENLLGENRDTSYLSSETFILTNSADEFLIVYGVNHEATGKATYSNFSVYQDKMKLGIVGKNSRELVHSAAEFLPPETEAQFYVWKLARVCPEGETNCLEIKIPDRLLPCTAVDLNQYLFVAFRAYLEPQTRVGPYWFELLYDRAIKFSPEP